MTLKCKQCSSSFEFESDDQECSSIERDKVHTRFACVAYGKCENCLSAFEISYTYWKDDISEELVNGIEEFESEEVELVQ